MGYRAGTTTTLATGDGWAGMILVASRISRYAIPGRRMRELIATRGGNPADVLMDVLIEEDGTVPTVLLSSFGSRYAAGDAAAVDVNTIRWHGGAPKQADRDWGQAPAPALLRHVSSRASPLCARVARADAAQKP